jgi:hypothetical protein
LPGGPESESTDDAADFIFAGGFLDTDKEGGTGSMLDASLLSCQKAAYHEVMQDLSCT